MTATPATALETAREAETLCWPETCERMGGVCTSHARIAAALTAFGASEFGRGEGAGMERAAKLMDEKGFRYSAATIRVASYARESDRALRSGVSCDCGPDIHTCGQKP